MRFTLESLAECLECVPDPAFAVDADGRIVAWNGVAKTTLGHSPENALGKPCHEILRGKDIFAKRICQRDCLVLRSARKREPAGRFRMHVRIRAGHHEEAECTTLQLWSTANELAVVHLLRLWPSGNQASMSSWRLGESRTFTEAIPSLTPREREVLKYLTAGESTQAMAAILGVSPATVRTHVENILRKLDVHSRLEAVAVALHRRLI